MTAAEEFRDLIERMDQLEEEISTAEMVVSLSVASVNEPIQGLNRLLRKARQLRRDVIRRCDDLLDRHPARWERSDNGSTVAHLRRLMTEMNLEDRYVVLSLDVSDRLELARSILEDRS